MSFEVQIITALAALISSVASLIWAFRRAK